MGEKSAEIIKVEDLGSAGVVLKALAPHGREELPRPGQFAMLRPAGASLQVFLGRPISYLDATARANGEAELSFYLKVVGEGTRALAELSPGDHLDYLGPFGAGFPVPRTAGWLVGGGVGIAPIHHLVAECARAGIEPERFRIFYGGRRAPDLPFLEGLTAYSGELTTTTEDGSAGVHGRVTDALEPALEALTPDQGDGVEVYTCGPTPMMAAVAALASRFDVGCLASLETRMACGYGVCLGCVVHLEGEGYVRTCVEGPVLDAHRLNFGERWL